MHSFAVDEPEARERLQELIGEQELIGKLVQQWQNPSPGAASEVLSWPLRRRRRVTSPFGERKHPVLGLPAWHDGIDIAAAKGTLIRAAASGTIAAVPVLPAHGQLVVINHGLGLVTVYAHLSTLDVRAGDVVASGDAIGTVGHSGWATGPHLHFEVWRDGSAIDPLSVVTPPPARVRRHPARGSRWRRIKGG